MPLGSCVHGPAGGTEIGALLPAFRAPACLVEVWFSWAAPINTGLISAAIHVPHSHRKSWERVYPQAYIFQTKLLLFATVIATRKAPEIFEITYCFSITASNFYPDA